MARVSWKRRYYKENEQMIFYDKILWSVITIAACLIILSITSAINIFILHMIRKNQTKRNDLLKEKKCYQRKTTKP